MPGMRCHRRFHDLVRELAVTDRHARTVQIVISCKPNAGLRAKQALLGNLVSPHFACSRATNFESCPLCTWMIPKLTSFSLLIHMNDLVLQIPAQGNVLVQLGSQLQKAAGLPQACSRPSHEELLAFACNKVAVVFACSTCLSCCARRRSSTIGLLRSPAPCA